MKDALTQRLSVLFLQGLVMLIGIGTLVLMLWEPHFEGRNVHATVFEVYFRDPFLAYVYLGSIAFFVALYQAFTLLRYVGQQKVFSHDAVRALRTIRYCAIILVAFIVGAFAFLFFAEHGEEDIAGGVAMGLFAMFLSVAMGATAVVLESIVQRAVDLKPENDFTAVARTSH